MTGAQRMCWGTLLDRWQHGPHSDAMPVWVARGLTTICPASLSAIHVLGAATLALCKPIPPVPSFRYLFPAFRVFSQTCRRTGGRVQLF